MAEDDDRPRVLGSNDLIEYQAYEDQHGGLSFKKIPDPRAELAIDLIKSWGMIAGQRGEDDSAGHGATHLMPVHVVISRAFAIADLAFREMDSRGWLVHLRPPEDLDQAKND